MKKIIKENVNLSSSDFLDITNQLITIVKHLNILGSISGPKAEYINKMKLQLIELLQDLDYEITEGNTIRTIKAEELQNTQNNYKIYSFETPEYRLNSIIGRVESILNTYDEKNLKAHDMLEMFIELKIIQNSLNNIQNLIRINQ